MHVITIGRPAQFYVSPMEGIELDHSLAGFRAPHLDGSEDARGHSAASAGAG